MAGPMIIKKDLKGDSLDDVQSSISKFSNEPQLNAGVLQQQNDASLSAQNWSSGSPDQDDRLPGDGQETAKIQEITKNCKVSIIKQGQLTFSEEQQKIHINSENGCFMKDNSTEHKEISSENILNVDPITDQNNSELTKLSQSQCCIAAVNDISKEHGTESSETNTNEQTKQHPAPTADGESSHQVMNKVLDFYRKFNERQLGLEGDCETPAYRKSSVPPSQVVSDNEIVREAVFRIAKKRQYQQIVKEPTISQAETEKFKKMYEERDMLQVNFNVDEDENLSSAEKASEVDKTYKDNFQCKDAQNYEYEWMYGNFIEKALEKRIDEEKEGYTHATKWDKTDIVKLVGMISKKRERAKPTEKRWRIQSVEYRDDLLSRLKEIDANTIHTESIFDILKRQPGGNDHEQLRNVVAQHCNDKGTITTVCKSAKVYYGGDEMLMIVDYIKWLFDFVWLWKTYDSFVGKWFNSYRYGANGGIASGYNEDAKWHKWAVGLNRIKSFAGWFSRGTFNRTGKPIYKQVEYKETNAVSLHEKFATEMEKNRTLKNRKLRNISEDTALDLESGINSAHCEEAQVKDKTRAVEYDQFCDTRNELSNNAIRYLSKSKKDYIMKFDI